MMIRARIPDQLGLSRSEIRAIEFAVSWRWFRSPISLGIFVLIGVIACGGLMMWPAWIPVGYLNSLPYSPVLPVVVMAACSSIIGVSLTLMFRSRLTRLLYAELRKRGHDVCPECGYVRVGLDEIAPCPECGTLSTANLL